MNETELNFNVKDKALSQIHAGRMVGCKCGINLVNFDLVNESYSSMQNKETKGVQIHKNMQVSWELYSHERLTAHPDKSQDECGTVSGLMAFPGKITLNRSSTNGDRENAKAAYPNAKQND